MDQTATRSRPHSRPPSRRRPLSDGAQRANTTPSPSSAKGQGKTSPVMNGSTHLPHHESIMPNGPLTVKTVTDAPDNKRLSAITNEDQTDSKRNSQVSTTSTNASTKGRRRKTHIGPWELGSDIGKGGCGKVRKVRHRQTGETAAVKIISKKTADKARAESLVDLVNSSKKSSLAAFGNVMPFGIEREVVIMKLLEHRNVVKLYDVWENRHELYLVMEYVKGGELFEYVEQEGYILEDETVWLFRQMLAALLHCNRLGIHHRDLKPENILLDQDTKEVKLVDFGMAALQPKGRNLTTACGSIHYAAPEVFEKRYDGAKVDVWSLGIILFVMLTGTTPFVYDPNKYDRNMQEWYLTLKKGEIEAPPVELTEEAMDLILKMLDPNPQTRITLEGAWNHPLMHKYAEEWGESLEKQSLEHWIGERPVIWHWTLKKRSDIDREILRNLRTLWHSEKEEVLVEKLLNPDPNQEKYFYSALERHRDEQLENYDSGADGLSYSTSDYHHIKPTAPASETQSMPRRRNVLRTQSQFSILNDEHLQSKSSFLEPPSSERSYDPYRSSRDPITGSKDGYTSVTVHRGPSKHSSTMSPSQRSRHAVSSRVEALKHDQRRLSTMSSSTSLKPLSARRISRASNARTMSKSSMASSLPPSSPPIAIRPSVKHKRAVNFSHLRKSSTASALTSRSMLTTPEKKAQTVKHLSADIRDPLSSPALYGDNRIRSKKEMEAISDPRARPQRSQTHSQVIDNEARKVSTELEHYIEERFNRSSTGSSHATSATPSQTVYDTPPSSISNRCSFHSVQDPLTPSASKRPLPEPPSETPNTYLTRELAETRRRLAARAAADTGVNDQTYTRTLAQLDAMIAVDISALNGRRTISLPEQKYSDYFSPLPAITEEEKSMETEGKRASSEDAQLKFASGEAINKKTRVQSWDRKQGTTIRVIEPSSPSRPAPLNIRKNSSATTISRRPTPMDTTIVRSNGGASGLPPRVTRVTTPTSPTRLNMFDELRTENKVTREEDGQTSQKKRPWWKRRTPQSIDQSKGTPMVSEEHHNRVASPKSTGSDGNMHRVRGVSDSLNMTSSKSPSPEPGLAGKRPGFLKFLRRTPKVREGRLGTGLDDQSPDTPTSTNFSTSTSGHSRTRARQNHSLEPSDYSQPQDLGVQRNWLSRFLHIKPATRILCFQTTRGRARQEIFRLLRSWRQYGIHDVIMDKGRNLIFGRLDSVNTLGIKEVEFAIELFVVLQEEKRKGLSAARFTQRRGAASSFRRMAAEVESRMGEKGLLVQDKAMRKEVEAVINGETGG